MRAPMFQQDEMYLLDCLTEIKKCYKTNPEKAKEYLLLMIENGGETCLEVRAARKEYFS